MTQYDPNKHHRHSIRLKGYDYGTSGLYFVTICVEGREKVFGNIINDEMVLNDAGRMVERWYDKTEDNYPDIVCHEMIVMLNHFHCIWQNVGADPCVRPDVVVSGEHAVSGGHAGEGGHSGPPLRMGGTQLSTVVQWFKTMTTNEYIRGVNKMGWLPFNGRLWQRNYYEHIIRSELSYNNIANYIITNPSRWKEDKFYLL